jgi:hypothetical protein
MLIAGILGAETGIVEVSGKLIVGTDGSPERFMVGTEGVESGKLMMGTENAA